MYRGLINCEVFRSKETAITTEHLEEVGIVGAGQAATQTSHQTARTTGPWFRAGRARSMSRMESRMMHRTSTSFVRPRPMKLCTARMHNRPRLSRGSLTARRILAYIKGTEPITPCRIAWNYYAWVMYSTSCRHSQANRVLTSTFTCSLLNGSVLWLQPQSTTRNLRIVPAL